MITILLEALVTVLLADLVVGFVHWLEDAYIREDTPLLGPVLARPNIIHHHLPRYFLRHDWWESNQYPLTASVLIVLGAWALGGLTWHVWLFAALTTNANEFHKWSHRTPSENGWLISLLQRLKVIQSQRHHAEHHTDPKNSHYCTLTCVLNPILDGIRFWAALEWLIELLFDVTRREDTSLRGCGPAPDWMRDLRRPAAESPTRH